MMTQVAYQAPDILTMAYKQPVMQDQLVLLQEKEQQIPGSVQYSIKRYSKNPQWSLDDMGMMVYHYKKEDPTRNFLELRFCVAGNVYCKKKDIECDSCKLNATPGCSERIDTVDVLSFRFLPVHLSQFARPRRTDSTVSDDLLEFRHLSSFSKTLSICGRTRMVLETLLNHSHTGSHENIYINAQSQMLLLYSLECMVGEKEVEGFQCKFLANEADREKIVQAREILLQHIGEPLTIKELSRKVAINECYLKKGFKEMFGTTIFDFYQGQRMEHARYLLYEKGLSVTEVSVMLGYSSISHFSTAFKKHTGLKPCELLLH
ncbi:AraC family transcriptional regulator [Puia sp.]|jgi:AraC-like DNA-binding protein|uniref:helix-turn-helix domain-containing protein n=1 Tax=Puia sp. TaxID=2045100 RepID=UPI002F424B15